MKTNIVKLTEYETGNDVYVDRDSIRSVRLLPAHTYEPVGGEGIPHELGRRTRVDTASDMFLVCESPGKVLGVNTKELVKKPGLYRLLTGVALINIALLITYVFYRLLRAKLMP